MRDIRESFYDSVGVVKPLVKNKWKAIKTGKLNNCELYKGKKGSFICVNERVVYAIEQLENIFMSCAYELEDIIIDACDNIVFIKPYWEEIFVKPLFQLDTRHKFIPAMKEIEKYF